MCYDWLNLQTGAGQVFSVRVSKEICPYLGVTVGRYLPRSSISKFEVHRTSDVQDGIEYENWIKSLKIISLGMNYCCFIYQSWAVFQNARFLKLQTD